VFVGQVVGPFEDGCKLGNAVGVPVRGLEVTGEMLGLLLGECVKEGASVSGEAEEGETVGLGVGNFVGLKLGPAVGFREGVAVGMLLVGVSVGAPVTGLAVIGCELGTPLVGISVVGANVGL